MKNLTTTFYALVILLAVACKKDATPGPSGATGSNGTTGPNGAPGIPGVNGTNGTTVLYSDWISPDKPTGPTNPPGTGQGSGSGNGSAVTQQSFSIPSAAITQDMIDKGVILAYCRLIDDNNKTRSLPTATLIAGYVSNWGFNVSPGKIEFTQLSQNPAGIPPISSSNLFRYVIIPPTKHVRLSKPLKDMTYEEICDMFNIPK